LHVVGEGDLDQLRIILPTQSRRARQLEELLGIGSIAPRGVSLVPALYVLHRPAKNGEIPHTLGSLVPFTRLNLLGLSGFLLITN
jgi:hypothetical protein